jgi:hypothetical protein
MIQLLVSQALACGGLFCSAPTLPVDQTGERIVFAIDENAGKIEMHTQIAYEGPADKFAWLVPVPEVPELFLSTEALFTFLDRNTAPIFNLTQICDCCGFPGAGGGVDTDFAADSGFGGEPPVTVIATATVGPYETVTLQATSSQVLLDWLNNNQYYIPGDVGPFLDPYVAAGSYIVALRLQKDRSIGELAPIGLTYAGTTPTIPLTMTAVAATPDMSLIPWVLGSGRAVPENYLHVVINELAIDWWTAGSNYSDVVGRAADLAGGQAFATDFAGLTTNLRDILVWDGRFRVNDLRATTNSRELWSAILQQGFVVDDRLTALMRRFFPDSDAVLADIGGGGRDSGSWGRDYDCDEEGELGCEPAATGAAVDALVAEVIEPLQRANDLFDRFVYITRLTSSASPAEMTVDPRFVINQGMPEVPQTRSATFQIGDCDEDGYNRLTLADGRWVDIPDEATLSSLSLTPSQYLANAFGDLPVERIEITGRSGDPVLVVDEAPQIDDIRDTLPGGAPPAEDVDVPGGGSSATTSRCGCDGVGGGAWASAALALVALRRRRGVQAR